MREELLLTVEESQTISTLQSRGTRMTSGNDKEVKKIKRTST